MAKNVRTNREKLERAIAKVPGDLFVEMRDVFKRSGIMFESELIKKRMSGRPGLRRRTGTLARSHTTVVEGTSLKSLKLITGIGGNAAPYAGVHEEGGTIKPKNSKYLAVPLNAAKTAAGASRFTSPRQVPGLFPIRSKAGNLLLVQKSGSGGSITPMYALVRSVTIKPRLRYFDTWRRLAAPRNKMISKAIDKVLNEVED